MIVERVLNNNAIQAVDSDEKHYVVLGKGIGFQKKRGDEIDRKKIEKTYVFKEEHDSVNQLLGSLSEGELDVINQIIQAAEKGLGQSFQANLLITLSDHIHYAIERTKKGEMIANLLYWEVKRLYKKEFSIGLYAIDLIKDDLGVDLGEQEAASIALHLINAQREDRQIDYTMHLVKLIDDIIHIVELQYGYLLDRESISYQRFVTHLQYFAERVYKKSILENEQDEFLFDQVKANYPKAFSCTIRIKKYIEENYDYYVSKDEQIYLTIHLQRLTK